MKVLVCGDVMQDEYWTGSTERISPEAPVPVVRVQHAETRYGGAANVAANAARLGAEVRLLGVAGKDEAGALLRDGGSPIYFTDDSNHIVGSLEATLLDSSSPTIRKLRVMSRHQQLIRLDFEQPLEFDRKALLFDFKTLAMSADVVILSDYGKGTLVDVDRMITWAQAPVLVDPKGTDWGKYRGATMLTPNLAEFEAVVGKCYDADQIASKAGSLTDHLGLKAVLVTRGEHGMTLVQYGKEPLHLPAVAREVYDVTGAGDTVIAAMAVGIADGMSFADAARFANKAAGIKVGKLGTATVSRAELERA